VKVFWFLLISHLLGDMLFISYRLAVLKRSSAFSAQSLGVGCHCLIHAVLAGVLLGLNQLPWLRGALMVFAFHFVIDLARSSVEKKRFGHGRIYVRRSEFLAWILGKSENRAKMNFRNLKPWIFINLLDQGAHLGSLLVIAGVL
jgi:hypothetical protein